MKFLDQNYLNHFRYKDCKKLFMKFFLPKNEVNAQYLIRKNIQQYRL